MWWRDLHDALRAERRSVAPGGKFLPGRPGLVGATAKDNRTFVNGVPWVLRSGAQWKDLPLEYDNWKSVHKRFIRWTRAGIWEKTFLVLLNDPDNRYVMILIPS